MSDLSHAATLFLIFAAVLALYGAALAQTGNKELLPSRAERSVRGSSDVKRVGKITMAVALVIGAIALLVRLVAG